MKKLYFLLLIFLVGVSVAVHGQPKKKRHRIHLEFYSGEIVKGDMKAMNDSSIEISDRKGRKSDAVYLVSAVRSLSFRRRNAPIKSVTAGAIIGLSVGFAIGSEYSVGYDCFPCIDSEPGENAAAFATAGTVVGGLIGLVSGSRFKKYQIDGDYTKYSEVRKKVRQYQSSTVEKTHDENAVMGVSAEGAN